MSSDVAAPLRRLAARSMIFTAADFLQMAIGFVLIPLYTKQLTSADYGTLSIAQTIGALLVVLYLQPLESVYTRFHYDHADEHRRRQFLGSAWLFQLVYATLASVALELAGRMGAFAFLGIAYDPYIRFVVWTTFLTVVALLLPRSLFLVREQAWHYAALNMVLFLLTLGLILYFVAGKGEGAAGSLKGIFIGTLCVAVPAIIVVLRNITLRVYFDDIRSALAFALPLVPHLAALWALNLADRLILQHYSDLDVVGVYTLGYQIGSIPQIIAFAIATAANPFYYRVAKRDDSAPLLGRMVTYYIFFLTWVGIATIALAPEAIGLIRARPVYAAALPVIPWVVLGSIGRGFYFVFLAALFHAKKIRALPLVTIGAALLNIGLNVALIPRFGYIAAAVTTFVAYAVQAIVLHRLAKRAYPVDYEWRRLLLLPIVGGAWTLMLSAITLGNAWTELVLKALLLVAFPVVLALFGFFPAAERRDLARLFSDDIIAREP